MELMKKIFTSDKEEKALVTEIDWICGIVINLGI